MTSSSSSSFQILEAPYDSPLFELVKQIRVAVFVDEQGYAASDEFDGYDDGCVHLLLVEDDGNGTQTPAGTLRYFPPSDTTKSEKMGRLAVAKQYRGKGLASKLLKELERMLVEGDLEACRGKKVTEIQCNAQVPVVPFYKGLGYITEGEEFLEDGTPHILMRKKITMTAA